ncbi:MAG TPA: type II secretion system F family protein [Solirubrobacterales bacterium]|nr:type II secretion system F family protein [Solirubrobacterales bacterium]
MSPQLAGLAGLLLFAAAWELAGMRGPKDALRFIPVVPHRIGGMRDLLAARLDIASRLARAGLRDRITERRFIGLKIAGACLGAFAAVAVAPVAPGRLAPILSLALVASGFVGPDAVAERIARRRRSVLVAALPDALDLVAVGAATGRTPVALFSEIATGTAGPLAAELALTIAEIEAGAGQAEALGSLRERTGAPELGAVGAALERSRRYGSPLAEQLHAQAQTMRSEEQRRIEERAARAAPKIQLVVAMVLVPSALLAIAAALVAHSDALFSAF